jgi:hypothetical protein
MDLATLEGAFIVETSPSFRGFTTVEQISDARGLVFRCPYCFFSAEGRVNHQVLIWRTGTPQNVPPLTRWTFSGTGLSDLTITPARGGLPKTGQCEWRVAVVNGQADVPEELSALPPLEPNVNGEVFTDWTLSPADVAKLQAGGKIRLRTWTFHGPLQPTVLRVIPANVP